MCQFSPETLPERAAPFPNRSRVAPASRARALPVSWKETLLPSAESLPVTEAASQSRPREDEPAVEVSISRMAEDLAMKRRSLGSPTAENPSARVMRRSSVGSALIWRLRLKPVALPGAGSGREMAPGVALVMVVATTVRVAGKMPSVWVGRSSRKRLFSASVRTAQSRRPSPVTVEISPVPVMGMERSSGFP